MSFFAGLAQGVQNGIPLGQAYLDAKERKRRESVLSQYGAGAYKGDPNALAQIATISPETAQGLGQNALAMQSAQRAHQMQGIAAGLAYFHDANTPQEFEARKAAWSKTPYADLVPPDQLTFENKDRLMQMATAYTRGMAPWEIEQAKTVAQQARVELDRSKAEMGAMAGAAIGQARGLLPDEPYRQPGGTTPPFNPAIGPERERPARDWIRYSNENAVRSQPLSDKLASALDFLPQMGVTMEVFSGGQPAAGEGGARTGSTRHDHGNAADVFFYKDGRKLDWNNPEDRPIFEEIVQRGKERGITGFGAGDGYMQPGSMHIGFGDEAVWGAGGKGANAADWLRGAYHTERARDAVVANNPALAGYAPQGAISEDQAALLGAMPQGEPEERTAAVKNAEAYADAKARQAGESVGPDSPVWMAAYTESLSPRAEGLVVRTNADGSTEIIQGGGNSELTKTNQTRVQDEILDLEDNIRLLTGAAERYKREYLTVRGRIASNAGSSLGRLNSEVADEAFDAIGPDLLGVDAEQAKALDAERGRFMARANQYFDQYKKMISGAAVAASEMQQLRESIANPDMSPQKFERVMSDTISFMERSIAYRKRILTEGIPIPRGPAADRLWNDVTEDYNLERANYRPPSAPAGQAAPAQNLNQDRDITLDPILNGQPSQLDATDDEVSKVQDLINRGMDPDEAIDQVLGGQRL